jgi:ribosomal protein S18 acetylase RimI-like enzyme
MGERAHASAPQRAAIEDLHAIVAALGDFWDGRDTAALHHALFIHELGDTARVVRDDDGAVLAYLLGFVGPKQIGYIHAVAVRADRRGDGLARMLYDDFERLARTQGATVLKAITRPDNVGSLAFHRALGFTASEVAGYSASGEARTVLRRELY